jgi:leader peptidase (prepilin peptidase)/N-methyltransferase
MVPILSYIFLKGRCRYCHSKIDITSTFMEFFSGVLFATAYYVFGPSYDFFIAIGIISLLMIIIVSDINYYIIPDELLIFMSIYFIVFNLISSGPQETYYSVCSGILLFSIMYSIMLIGNKILKKETLGGGDIKLMFVFGIILGPVLGLFSIFIGSVIALPVSIFMLKKEKESIIPFGPFLLIALTLLYFTGITPEVILNLLKVY